MLVSMTPNDEVKTIHASLNDGKLRKWEFEPYTENGKIELTDQDYATIQSIKGNTVKFNQLVGTSTSSLTLTNGHKYYTVIGGTKAITNGTGQSISVTGGTDMAIDLTLMGIDSLTTVEQVETWLSNNIGLLPYYDYTLGTLIPFKGTWLKTVGFNQWDEEWEVGSIYRGELVSSTNSIRSKTFSDCIGGATYYLKCANHTNNRYWMAIFYYDGSKNYISMEYASGSTVIAPTNARYFKISTNPSTYVYGNTYNNDICINISDTSKNGTYEPYTESTLSLPISTYFPTGMKSAGSVYDELTESKAITRIGSRAYQSGDESDTSVITDGTTTYYALATPTETTINPPLDLSYDVWDNGTEQILPVNGSTPTTSSMKATIEYPDRTEDVNFLYKQTTFESAIPQFSLVCKNQELPMTLEDGKLICECDSSITNESGFFDCKVKMQDLDSVAYSQKIQLHVERGIND